MTSLRRLEGEVVGEKSTVADLLIRAEVKRGKNA